MPVEDVSEDGEAIWVMADMALRFEDIPDMPDMVMPGILDIPIPIDMLGTELNMLLGLSTVIIY